MADVWSDVTEQPIPVIKSGTCPNVIADSTRRLQQCLQEQLTHLDTRAKALATCGNFEAALKDATRIRQLVPSSAAGYLCAGHVYSLQGRQEAAIDIYDEGLAAVPSSDPSHQRLVEARSMAQQRDSTRIDFINKLPLDITMNIVPRIMLCDGSVPPSEIRDYLEVSRVWREKLLACVGELHVLSTIDDSHLDDKELLGLIAPYCTTLTLESKVTCLRQFISDTQFPLLRSLHIVQAWDSAGGDYDEEDEYGSGYLRDIIASFRSTATLTHLRIFADESCYIPFADILSNCPSLVDLEATCIDSDMSTAPTSCPNMKSVSFMLNEEQEFDMDDITKRFPELEKLVISPFYYAGALSTIQRNCPKLKIIGSHGDGGFLATTNDDDTPTTTMDGVRMLYLHDYVTHWLDPYEGEMDYVMEFMQQNSHTLQDVSFYTSFPYSDEPPIVANSHAVTFPQMTSYKQQKIYVPQHLRIAKMVVQKSPHLKHFELVRGGFDDDDKIYVNVGELFDDLIGLSTLKSAIIKLASNDPMLDKESVERFIQYHSTIDSQLHTLILPQNMRLSNDALDTLTALPQLKTLGLDLSLVQDEDAKDDEKVSSFIQKLGSGCPQLQHLELLSEGPIPDVVFVQLSKLNITSLQLTMLSPIMGKKKAATSLLHLLECPQLQELYISPPCNTKNQTNAFIRRMLESQIPKLCW
ncbi:hypothetical protein O0I10_012775 [Lichtheimia ornata]|uniref:Uncharacterized protein n=1 Tax=Lichtheimia ornata TaxID=688661 RepID=A0AAD7UR75_9FUNG|nr:uncharacterized protein O0I10_012775 [Lichtheimia ornata]KAJ8651658.1 hypothetical protein O0I10_012775 [Lichtheimia ornata]